MAIMRNGRKNKFMIRYIVYVPAHEITIDAVDELEAFEKAIESIHYSDTKIEVVDTWE